MEEHLVNEEAADGANHNENTGLWQNFLQKMNVVKEDLEDAGEYEHSSEEERARELCPSPRSFKKIERWSSFEDIKLANVLLHMFVFSHTEVYPMVQVSGVSVSSLRVCCDILLAIFHFHLNFERGVHRPH